MNRLYLVRMDDSLTLGDYERLSAHLSDERRARLDQIPDVRARKEALFAHLLLRAALRHTLPKGGGELSLRIGRRGKPYIEGMPSLQCSLSHTRGAAAAALSENPVGVDIEKIRSANLKIAARFFTENETAYLLAGDADRRFFEIWTRKEAYLKCTGEGLSGLSSCPDVLCGLDGRLQTVESAGYMISLCVDTLSDAAPAPLVELSEEQLRQESAE